ncbi:hypothetical protein TRFO_13275 [Tritrichomonas foetus]|uniref:Uncharacterized protein n=1 Tax=Tritrichomonas foetus TaxID=1144522 RepID=A0A1J4L2U3_9EUKA|nr:hypothetical protein TRFO_13275 [Tritrichomonas foetus]|eukprot:OHT16270.1 hypothetical protein TRFO_13275 [Tritrichomonas foetus]
MNEYSTTEQTSPGKFSTCTNTTNATCSTNFTQAENELNLLQNEILEQGKNIEQFILFHEKNHKQSPTFRALVMLFELFKSELSMNLSLRRNLMEEKQEHQQIIEFCEKLQIEKDQFFHQITKGSSTKICDYDHVISFVIDQMKIAENGLKFREKNKTLMSSNSKIEKENQNLITKNQKIEIENQNLKKQVNEMQSSIQSMSKIEMENHQLKLKINELQQAFDVQQAQNSLDYAKINAKCDMSEQKINILIEENNQLKKEKERIETLFNQQTTSNEQLQKKLELKKQKIESLKKEVYKYQTNHQSDQDVLSSDPNEVVSSLKNQNEHLKTQINQYKNELSDTQNAINEMKARFKRSSAIEEKISKLKQKNKNLKSQIKKNGDAVSLLQQCKDSYIASRNKAKEYRIQIEQLESKLKEHKNAFSRINELTSKVHLLESANQKIIDNIQNQSKDQSKVVAMRLQSLESKFNSIQQEYSSVSSENKRLYSQLRQSSVDMQRLEAENARLYTTVDRLQRDLNDSKSTAWLSNETANESSFSNQNNIRNLRDFRSNKSRTYYGEEEEVNANYDSDFIPVNIASSGSGRYAKTNNSDSSSSPNTMLQKEINSLQDDIASLKRDMKRVE